jgi:hypothetical protein
MKAKILIVLKFIFVSSFLFVTFLFLYPSSLACASDYIPRASGEIQIDGIIQESGWEQGLIISQFYEVDPGENTEPPVETVAYLTYDQENFYMAFKCLDPRPEEIRARYADRDKMFADDFAGIILDTFNDQRYGVEFFVNPLGVQGDLSRRDPYEEDDTWDTIWDSAGRITEEGYEVEAAIPFKSLRFPNKDVQTWRFLLIRIYPRNFRYQITSTTIDRNKNCSLCQYPTYSGMEGVKPGRNIEIIPSATGMRTESEYKEAEFEGEASLNATWGITPNLTLKGTINPDFSQVEADVLQIDVNRRFALFFPEKRPFFLEGQNIFETYFNAYYSRTIADPLWGAKFTGKTDKNSYGMIFAQDDQANFLIPSNQRSWLFSWNGQELNSGIFRYQRDVGQDSNVGLIFTGRQGGDYQNYLFGADARIRLAENDFLHSQVLRSETEYPLLPEVSEFFDGSKPGGNAYFFSYEHSAEHWSYELWYLDKDPEFRADLGFIPRVDVKAYGGYLGYSFYGNGNPYFSRINPFVHASRTENHAGVTTDWDGEVGVHYQLPRQTNGEIEFDRSMELFKGIEYKKNTFFLWTNSRFSKAMTAFIRFGYGDQVDYVNERLGDGREFGFQFDYRFGKHVFLDARFDREVLKVDGGRLFKANVYYIKGLYHFNKNLFFRTTVQWEDIDRNLALYNEEVRADLTENSKLFTYQLLFTYKINPFTLLYLGYTDRGFEEDHIDSITLEKTYFLKLSYAFRP